MKKAEAKSQSEAIKSTSATNSNNTRKFFNNTRIKSDHFFGQNFIQPKLKIGQPNDKYEIEADHIADQVMSMPDSGVQRKCKECREEEKLQKKSEAHTKTGSNYASDDVSSKLNSSVGHGSPLPHKIRTEMGNKMKADFSNVNIHTDSNSHQVNQQLGAKAFTYGSDIYFNKDEYNPNSQTGKRLLAHELTHVVQQMSMHPTVQRFPGEANCPEPIVEDQHPGSCPEITRNDNELSNYQSLGVTVERVSQNCWVIMNLPSGVAFYGPQDKIQPITDLLRISSPMSTMTITGYSDCITHGGASLNRSLRYQRANAVEQLFLNAGIQQNRIIAEAAPSTEYIASNATAEGRAKNRGVIISITSQVGLTDTESEQTHGTNQPCEPFSLSLPSAISDEILYQKNQINAILHLIDRKIGHIALGIEISGSAEDIVGGGMAVDVVGVVNADSPNRVNFEASGAGQAIAGAGGGVSVRGLIAFQIIPENEAPGAEDFGRHGLAYGLSGSFIGGIGVSVSNSLIIDMFDSGKQRGWLTFTFGAGAEAEAQGSASYGSSVTELCEIIMRIVSHYLNNSG